MTDFIIKFPVYSERFKPVIRSYYYEKEGNGCCDKAKRLD